MQQETNILHVFLNKYEAENSQRLRKISKLRQAEFQVITGENLF